jgi:hypothetical protein
MNVRTAKSAMKAINPNPAAANPRPTPLPSGIKAAAKARIREEVTSKTKTDMALLKCGRVILPVEMLVTLERLVLNKAVTIIKKAKNKTKSPALPVLIFPENKAPRRCQEKP